MAKKRTDHKFSKQGPEAARYRQPGAPFDTNACPLASQDGRKFKVPDPCENDEHCQFLKKPTTGRKG